MENMKTEPKVKVVKLILEDHEVRVARKDAGFRFVIVDKRSDSNRGFSPNKKRTLVLPEFQKV